MARWIVVENTSRGEEHRLDNEDRRFDMYEGLQRPTMERGRASYHHGKALNHAIASVKSRFLLILDPDFFIVLPNWISHVLAYMKRRRLAFFGAPWHPRWYRKWRYFPCAHCMFVDLECVDLGELDFKPEIYEQPRPYFSWYLAELEWMFVRGQKLRACLRALRHASTTLTEDHRRRLAIGTSRDTSIRIRDRFAHRVDMRSETLTPVYVPYVDRLVPVPDVRIDNRSFLRELLECIQPDGLSYIPKRRAYFSRSGFQSFGFPDFRAYGAEEFLWLGRPFGFHMRRGQKSDKEQLKDLEQLEHLIHLWGGLRE